MVARNIISALFIDYDNVRTELDRYDPGVAARFSNKTLVWLDALEKELGSDTESRRIVSRRCYASPQRIQPYRRNFTQTGFEVIDCPPLTTHLKNSADIYIVMDVIDYLSRYPHIDEYIILSGDADFVPVLNRLRRELKRSVIFASYNTTAAYRNCSDQRIEAEFFAEHLAVQSAVAPAGEPPRSAGARGAAARPSDAALAEAMGGCLKRSAARRGGRLPFATVAHALRDQLDIDLGADWGGRRTLTALLEQVPPSGVKIDWNQQEIIDPDFGSLENWDEVPRATLKGFVEAVNAATSKPIPLLDPASYSRIFEELAAYFRQDAPGTFTEAINSVTDACLKHGADVMAAEIRFVATGISMQQYRFSEAENAVHLASLWRTQIFDLCGEPDWMREPENAERLAAWFHASDESVASARDDFLLQTDDNEDTEAEGGA